MKSLRARKKAQVEKALADDKAQELVTCVLSEIFEL